MAVGVKQYSTGNPLIDGVLIGAKWSGTVTYSFTDSASDYASGYYYPNYVSAISPFSALQQTAITTAFALIQSYCNLQVVFAGTGAADIRIANTNSTSLSSAQVADFPQALTTPGNYGEQGDIWIGPNNSRSPRPGDFSYQTIFHELGHALGLKHSHQSFGGNGPLPSAYDWLGYSTMSYRSYQNMVVDGYNHAVHLPTTYMANDILGLQAMYGANYTSNAGNTIYTWSATTGQQSINGVAQALPVSNTIFMTVWDGGGVDTYDLSNYTTSLQINLAPGAYTITSATQRPNLGEGNLGANIYNAWLFNNDTRSLIENANGGSANDTIIGNQGANQLEGRGGNDTLNGAAGNDTLIGGGGSDFIDGGADSDTAVYEVARSAVTVTYDAASQRFTITNATTGTDTVSNVEFFRFTDGTFTAEQMRNVDTTAPTLVSTAPADNATGVAPSANLIFTFSESVVAGTGNIVIFNSDGTVARTIAVTDTGQVSFSGSTMTVNPSTDLSASGNYYINIASGVIRDTTGNPYAGLSGTTAYNFTIASAADTTAPTVTSLSPADDAVGVATGANLVITFNEAVQAGTGDIVILSTGGAVVRTIAITDATQVTISGNTVTINPSADLSNATGYYVNMASGVVRDLAGNAFGGFSSATAWNFTTGGAGSGDDYAGSTATTGSVTVNGAVVSGNIETAGDTDWFRVNLVAGQRYQFDLIGAGSKPLGDTYLVLRDSAGNILAFDDDSGDGLNSLLAYTALTTGVFYLEARAYDPSVTGTYTLQARFSDTTAPTLVSSNPADNATNVQPYANLVLTFSETVQAGASGNITIYNSSGTVFQQIAVNDHGSVTFSGSTITINPSVDLAANAGYYINIDAGAVRDLAGNAFAGITGSTALNFTTVTPTDDFSANTSTTGSVTPNGSLVAGNIETSGDLDWFRITLTAGVEYSLSLSGEDGTLSDPFLTLRDSAGVSLLTNDNAPNSLNSVITFTPTTTGTYYLEARHASTGTGTYFVGARTTDTTAPGLTSANPPHLASGVLASTNFVLTFTENVRAGSGNFIIYNSNGSVARTINTADTSQVSFSGNTVTINPTFDLSTGSSYYINIDNGAITDITGNAYAGLSGPTPYTFTTSGVTDDYPLSIATAGVVTVGGPATAGNIETANDGDAFRVTLTAGNGYTFTMNGTGGTGGLGDPYLELRDSTGAFITYNDDFNGLNSQITFTPTTSGTYFLYAYAYSTGTGTYTIGATTSGPDTTAPQITGFYPPDDSTNLAHGIGLYFLFNESIVAGSGNITIYNSNGTAARTISVTDTSQVSIFGSTLFVQPATQLDPGGSYYVNIAPGAVRDAAGNNFAGISNNTTYNFTITTAIDDYPFSLATPGFVTLNAPATTGSIESVGDIDLYRVTLTAGATYTFTLNSAVGGLDDPYLELFDANGLYLTFNDDFSGLNSQITFTATTSGTHFLAASAYSTGTGGYLLAASSSTADSTAPTFVSGLPADNATGVNFGANFVLTFSEAMTAGSGNIIIYNSNGTVARTISASDSTQVSFAGNTVTINPTDNLGAGRSYYIQMGSGVLRDINNNSFAGILTTTAYDFATAPITGTTSNDSLVGGPAEDTINALEGEDILTGAAGDDILNGGPGNDVMDGGSGGDQMTGGTGDDRYIVDSLGDATIELAGEGVDEVVVYGDWTLGANIELLTLAAGSAGAGNASDNAITGNANANFLSGLGGNDRLIGLGGNDVLDGGVGGDEMTGGTGNDQYVVDSIGDTTIENPNEGTDEVVASIDWTLAANVENLTLGGSAFRGTGNSANNVIAGTGGANLLEGLGGNDRLIGLGGADTLDGGTGGDEMIGGLGDDRYIVDSLGDTTIEQAGEGTDEVVAYGDWTLGGNIELLTLAAGAVGVGNALANTITGNGNANFLAGVDGADRLIGLGGNDVLDGGTGGDEMIGGAGNDQYIVDSLGDTTLELVGEGTDEIVVYGDW
ncbi:MAG: Ig-like domain-containing protein, partial [Hyphomonadaceae bacterium]